MLGRYPRERRCARAQLSRAEPSGVTPSHARRRLARTFRLVPVLAALVLATRTAVFLLHLVLLLMPAAQLVNWLHIHRYPRMPTVLAAIVAMALCLDDGTWRDLARLASTPWTAPDQADAPIAALLTLGQSLAAGALGLLLAYVSLSRSGREPTFS